MRQQWLHLLQQCRQGSRCLHGSENNQSCDHIRHCTQLQPVVTRLSQVCKLAYNSGVQRAKHMCACCLANFLLHEPYQACQGPACQAWRHTHMMERRAKQALQSALPSGFWGMPPAPPQTTELEPWQIMQPPQPRSGDAPPPAGDLEPWQILQRPQRQQPESVWTAYGYSAGPPPPPPQGLPAKHWCTPPLMPAQCSLAWHPQPHQDQQPQHHLQQQPRQPQHHHAMKRWFCSTQLRKGSMSSMPRLTILLGKCRFSWISPVKLCERTAALQPMQVLNRR